MIAKHEHHTSMWKPFRQIVFFAIRKLRAPLRRLRCSSTYEASSLASIVPFAPKKNTKLSNCAENGYLTPLRHAAPTMPCAPKKNTKLSNCAESGYRTPLRRAAPTMPCAPKKNTKLSNCAENGYLTPPRMTHRYRSSSEECKLRTEIVQNPENELREVATVNRYETPPQRPRFIEPSGPQKKRRSSPKKLYFCVNL